MADAESTQRDEGTVRTAVARRFGAVGRTLARPAVVAGLSFALLFFGLLVDLTTEQDLVVAMVYDIPIAVSALAASRRLSLSMIVLALVANVAAAYENAANVGGFDTVVSLNRGFAAISFIVVGGVTLARVQAIDQVVELGEAQSTADREQRLRDFINAVGEAADGRDVLAKASTELRTLLGAEAVVIVGVHDGHFAEPRFAARGDSLAVVDEPAAWAVEVVPTDGARTATVRSSRGLTTSGWWRREGQAALAVVVDQPRVDRPSRMLADALDTLEPLLRLAERSASSNAANG